ncbi:MAG: nucleoside monophosphate kinase [Alphaproteobacteria bacterium]|nr:nucleoside monophosphate kinase [Alphaproteobacteria bacterium]
MMKQKNDMIIMMGGPGTGKGTFSRMLHELYPEYTHIETGAILRAQPDGSPIRMAIAGGNLIPDEMVCDLITQTLAQNHGNKILDGFPRTLIQAQWLVKNYADTYNIHVIYLNVSDKIMVRRIQKRKSEGSNRRDDSNMSIVNHRIETFHNTTMPAITWLAGVGDITFSDIDSNGPENENFDHIVDALNTNK